MTDHASPPASTGPQLPARTTPTWEVELLISGVAVFAMLQLPGWLDDVYFTLQPRFGGGWQMVLMLLYMYTKGAALILALTFVLHLLLRARWIALVGMHSVYPDGILWEKLRMGPILREVERARELPFPSIVERADNRATVVFATGVMLAMFVVNITLIAGPLSALAIFLSTRSGGLLRFDIVLLALLAVWILPFSLAMALDRDRSTPYPPESRLRRLLRWLLELYARAGFSRNNNPVMALLSSHGGDRKMIATTVLVTVIAILLAMTSIIFQRAPNRFGSYGLFPTGSDTRSIDGAHYDDQRNPARDPAVPYIPSLVATAPYLRLVVPYRPDRDAAALRNRCAHAQPIEDTGQRADARLACLSALHAVSLDGRPLDGLRYDVTSDPRTNRPALLAMIDVRDLPRGRHELRIARPARDDSDGDTNRKTRNHDPGYDLIPFWR